MDYKVILMIVVFFGSFVLIQGLFATEYISSSMSGIYTSEWNGTVYSNLTSREGGGGIPTPPTCDSGYVFIDGLVACGAGYVGYFWDLLTFSSSVWWLQILFIIPLLVILGYFIIHLIIRLAEALPFT